MNPDEQKRWQSEILDEIFVALAGSAQLEKCLVYKGARVLRLFLGAGRQSLDIDTNLTVAFVQEHPEREEQRRFLEEQLALAIRQHFERQSPVHFELTRLQIRPQPPQRHPQGWDAFAVRLNVNDLRKRVLGLPALEIDIAAPEALRNDSVAILARDGWQIRAYTLQRIAGEKLRAFLSSLPAYRKKVAKPGDAVRAKDLYDLAQIHRTRPLTQYEFWRQVGQEFRLACQSRFIDCAGLATFKEAWQVTESTYRGSPLPPDVSFAEAETTLTDIVGFFVAEGIVPFAFPLAAPAAPTPG